MLAIDVQNIVKKFADFTAVKDVSLKIKGGEFFSILGPSGCGKTTLLRAISGFLRPTEGSIRIGGLDMTGIESNKRPTALIFPPTGTTNSATPSLPAVAT